MATGEAAQKRLPKLFLGSERFGSVLGASVLGSGVFGGGSQQDATFRLLDRARELGDVGIDVAASYQLGGSERLLGLWLERSGNRARIYLSSKGGHPIPVLAPNRLRPKDITADLHASLKRLKTDFLDLYLLHRDHEDADLDAIARTLASHQRAGKIVAFGVSNWHHTRVAELAKRVRESEGLELAASSPQFSLAAWSRPLWEGCVSISGEAGAAGRQYYEATQLPVIAYSALGRGLLGAGASSQAPQEFRHAQNHARQTRAEALARRLGWTATEVALAYLVSQPFPVHPVIATSNIGHLTENLAALERRLSPADSAWLERGDGDAVAEIRGTGS
jgi:aryl-alcohol dehydrogenase-like predicted oxidoreductase